MHLGSIVPVMLSLAMPLAGVAFAAQTAKPSDNGVLIAVYPPWWSPGRALAAASDAGHVLNAGALPFVYVVQSTQPDFMARLWQSGAWGIMSPLGLDGCETRPGANNV
jgi:hypothetical protein